MEDLVPLIQSDDRYEFIANNVSINGNNISVNNTIIGTYSIANNVVTCTLNSSANPSLVDELIKSFTYSNTSQDPALKAIQIDWRLSKLSNEITGSNFFFCIPINDPPTFSFESVINKEFLPGQQIGQNGSVIEYSKIKLFEKLNSSNNLVNVPVSISTIEANQNITQIKFKVTASDSWISVNSYVEEYLIINNNAHRLNSSTFVENGLNFAFSVSGNVLTCTIDNPLNKSIQEITDLLSNMYYTTNAASPNINQNPTRLFEFTSITDNGFNEINSTNSVFNKNFSDLIYNDTQNRLKITFKSNAVINAIPYTYLSTPANLTSLGDYPTNRLKLDLWTSYKESAGYNETTQYIKKFKLKVSNVYPSSSQETGTEKIQISSTLLDLGVNSSGTINNTPYVLTYDNSLKESIITFGDDNSNFGNAIGSDQTTLSTFLSSVKYFNIDETPATNIRSFTLYNFIDNLDAVSTQEVKLFVSPVAPPALPFSISWKQNYNFSNDEGGENIVKLVLNGTIPASAYDYDNNGTPSYLLALAFTQNDGRSTISSTSPYFKNITFSTGPSSPYLVIPNSLALNNLEIDLKISSIDDAVINNSQYYSYGLNVKEMASANYLGTVSSTPNYFLLTYSDPTFTIRDNDIPIMTITPTSKTVYEGQLNQSINVKLNLFPQKNPANEITKVFVERVKLDGSIETDNTEINNFPTFFYFTNKRAGEGYETVITKDVNFDALLDATADGDQVVRLKFTVEKTYSVTCNGSSTCTIDYNNPSSYTIGSGSTTPFTNLTSTALINVKDVDIPLIFSENNLISQDIPEGTTKNFKIYLNDIPKNITITNNNPSLFEITQTSLTFAGTGTPSAINLAVTATENSTFGNFTGTITLSDQTNFYAQPLILNVTGIDNDAKVVISPTTFPTGLTWTGTSTVTFSVALASLPTNNVSVSLSVPAYTIPNPPGSGNPSESKMYPIKLGTNQNLVLNFTPQNGTTPQTVTASVYLMGQNGNLLNSSATNFNNNIGNFTSQSISISTSTSADPVYAALSNTTYPYSIAKSTTSTGGGTSTSSSILKGSAHTFTAGTDMKLDKCEANSAGTLRFLVDLTAPSNAGLDITKIYLKLSPSIFSNSNTAAPSPTIPNTYRLISIPISSSKLTEFWNAGKTSGSYSQTYFVKYGDIVNDASNTPLTNFTDILSIDPTILTCTAADASAPLIYQTGTTVSITSSPYSITAAENQVSVYDFDVNETVTWSISGTNANLFNINLNDGRLTFKTAPDYETITGPFSINVIATDAAGNVTTKVVSVTVTNVIEAGVSITLVDGELLENPSPGSQYNGSFDIVLTHQPSSDVTIPLTSSDITEGTVQSSVTFTPSNWNIPQRVIVYMVDDLIGDGAVSFTIATGTASTTSIDYATLQASNIADVVMTTQNNDPPGIIAEIVGSTNVTSEVGASVQIRFKLLSQPANGGSVTIPLSLSNTNEGILSASSITIDNANWSSTTNIITVTGKDDAVLDGDILYQLITGDPTSSLDPAYDALVASDIVDISLINQDNEVPDVTPPTVVLTHSGSDLIVRDADTETITATFSESMTATPTITITYSNGTTLSGVLMSGSTTTWTYVWDVPPVNDGTAVVTIVGSDLSGNAYIGNSNLIFTIDNFTTPTTVPSAPLVTSQTTNNVTPTITGTAEANAIVTVSVNGSTYTTTANSSGNWSITTSTLPSGTYSVTATATDAAGNVSPVGTGTLVIDNTAPLAPVVNNRTTNNVTPTITGTAEANAIVTVSVNGSTYTTTANSSGNWSITTSTLPSGTYSVTATATDAAGNVSPVGTGTLVIDNTAPLAPVVNNRTTNNVTPTITGTAEANAIVTVSVNGSTYTTTANSSGNWSITTSTLPSGTYSVTATATDAAGNVSPVGTGTLVIDNTAPLAPVVNNQTTNNVTPTITGTAEANAIVTVSVNGSTYTTTANSSGNWSITTSTLPSGTYSVTATATDAAGNVSPVGTGTLVIDNTAPLAPVVNNRTTNNVTPTITGTAEANAIVTVSVNGSTYTTTANSSGNWSITTSTLPSGTYSVTATATDAAGNVSPVGTGTLVIDNTAPLAPCSK